MYTIIPGQDTAYNESIDAVFTSPGAYGVHFADSDTPSLLVVGVVPASPAEHQAPVFEIDFAAQSLGMALKSCSCLSGVLSVSGLRFTSFHHTAPH